MTMDDMDRAHQGRVAVRSFQIIAHALLLRGHYSMAGQSGQALEAALRTLSPEIYGSMNDPKIIELKGLEYIMDRLPRGIEQCSRFVMTVKDDLEGTSFKKLRPPKRRRISYRVSKNEMGFVISTGMSEIYDILTHLTFLYLEAKHIHAKTTEKDGKPIREWLRFENDVHREADLGEEDLEQAIWNLSILLGRTYHETRQTYDYFDRARDELESNNGLFQIIHSLRNLIEKETQENDLLVVYFRPSLIDHIMHQLYGKKWATAIKNKLIDLGFQERPLHIISANLHSVVNLLYGYAAIRDRKEKEPAGDLYAFIQHISDKQEQVKAFAVKHGLHEMTDESGAQTDWQIIDAAKLKSIDLHPGIKVNLDAQSKPMPALLVMDYAFGFQAFELMDELLQPLDTKGSAGALQVHSISIMGKAGILPGKKGDIMLATAHVLEGPAHNYIVDNDLSREDFDEDIDIYAGPIVTVLGTSLQNRDILEKFQITSWKAVGLEMEGGHYQRAINAAIIRGHIPKDVKVRYAYYASDNPLKSGQTLAAGPMGLEGIRPTYMITKAVISRIFG
jgi:hypothetical protein